MPAIECPECHHGFAVELTSDALKDSRVSYVVHPEPRRLMQARSIGAQLKAIGTLLETCAKQDGADMAALVESIATSDDGSIKFTLLVAHRKRPDAA